MEVKLITELILKEKGIVSRNQTNEPRIFEKRRDLLV